MGRQLLPITGQEGRREGERREGRKEGGREGRKEGGMHPSILRSHKDHTWIGHTWITHGSVTQGEIAETREPAGDAYTQGVKASCRTDGTAEELKNAIKQHGAIETQVPELLNSKRWKLHVAERGGSTGDDRALRVGMEAAASVRKCHVFQSSAPTVPLVRENMCIKDLCSRQPCGAEPPPPGQTKSPAPAKKSHQQSSTWR